MKADEAARESRLTKQDRYAETRRRKDEEREAKERQLVSLSSLLFWFRNILSCVPFLRISTWFIQEEEAKAQKAKEDEAAALEFEKWKGEFSVDAEGTTENEMQDGNQGLLVDFVEYIKVVFLSLCYLDSFCRVLSYIS